MPFILKAGKALDDRKAEIRVQFQEVPHYLFPGDSRAWRNELVVRLQPVGGWVAVTWVGAGKSAQGAQWADQGAGALGCARAAVAGQFQSPGAWLIVHKDAGAQSQC